VRAPLSQRRKALAAHHAQLALLLIARGSAHGQFQFFRASLYGYMMLPVLGRPQDHLLAVGAELIEVIGSTFWTLHRFLPWMFA
jgi:hypothetical protein